MKKAIVVVSVFVLFIGIPLIALPFVYVPKTVIQAYQVPQSTVVTSSCVPVLDYGNIPVNDVTEELSLNAKDSLNIQVNATSSKDIDFSVNDGSTTYMSYPNATLINTDWTVPQNSTYNFVFKSSNSFTSKDITWQVTKQGSETAYRDIAQNARVLPFEIFYCGVVIVLAGIALTFYGVVKLKTSKNQLSLQFFNF